VFGSGTFPGEARNESEVWRLDGAIFQRETSFEGATFHRNAAFGGATFHRNAAFDGAIFQGGAWFRRATFQAEVAFGRATFQGQRMLSGAHVLGLADSYRSERRVWPDGYTVCPDPADPTRGTLIYAE
jgi:Pentapeptide repeats (9 copies)